MWCSVHPSPPQAPRSASAQQRIRTVSPPRSISISSAKPVLTLELRCSILGRPGEGRACCIAIAVIVACARCGASDVGVSLIYRDARHSLARQPQRLELDHGTRTSARCLPQRLGSRWVDIQRVRSSQVADRSGDNTLSRMIAVDEVRGSRDELLCDGDDVKAERVIREPNPTRVRGIAASPSWIDMIGGGILSHGISGAPRRFSHSGIRIWLSSQLRADHNAYEVHGYSVTPFQQVYHLSLGGTLGAFISPFVPDDGIRLGWRDPEAGIGRSS
jgi:hypothetical protein